jgi:hypothetical protein
MIEDRQVVAVMGRVVSSSGQLGLPREDLVGLPEQAENRRPVLGRGFEQGVFQDGQGGCVIPGLDQPSPLGDRTALSRAGSVRPRRRGQDQAQTHQYPRDPLAHDIPVHCVVPTVLMAAGSETGRENRRVAVGFPTPLRSEAGLP